MFFARGEDALSIEELPERTPLLATAPMHPDSFRETQPKTWRRYVQVQMKIPRVQTITGVLLGLLLLAMILMLVAEAIREAREPDPFLVDYSTSPKPFTGLINLQSTDVKQAWIEGEGLVAYRKNMEKIIDTALLPDHCLPDKPNICNSTDRYRTFNGSCNNLEHPDWGMTSTAFRRLLRPDYADDVSMPRLSTVGEELPNARYLSNELYTHHSRPRCNCTVLTLYFGLFIDHDIIRIASKTGRAMK
ncbi:UNVERIFIED_CONTAM: pxt [Trichonephila clavipes]